MSVARDLPQLIVADAAGWRAWLAQHHAQPGGVLLVLAKTGVVEPTKLTYGEALEEGCATAGSMASFRNATSRPTIGASRHADRAVRGHGETWRSSIACSRRVE